MLLAMYHAVRILEPKKVLGLQDRRKNVWKCRPMLPKSQCYAVPLLLKMLFFFSSSIAFVSFCSSAPGPNPSLNMPQVWIF